MTYLDYAATSPLLPVVKEGLKQLIELDLGNASSLHSSGQATKQIIEDARQQVAELIGVHPEEIIFTSGGSESNNTIIHSFVGKKIAVSTIEHPSVLETAKAYTKKLRLINADRWGRVSHRHIPKEMDLISVMTANNELGTRQPIREIADFCRNNEELLHTDATQAIGKIRINAKKLGVDYLTFSGHKIGAPLGVGVIYVNKDNPKAKLSPLIFGGHQEGNLRAGTQNALAIAGLGLAAQWVSRSEPWKTYLTRIAPLRDQLRDWILAEIPHSSVNSPEKNCLPNILNMSFEAAEGESIQLYLDAEGIQVSTGSACAAGDIQPSHVLMATRNDAELAHSSIRFSFGLDTDEADIEHLKRVLPGIIKKLQGISTIKTGGLN